MGNRTNLLATNLPEVKTNEKITRVIIVVDRSGSMADFKDQVPKQLKNQLQVIYNQSEGKVDVSLLDFSYNTHFVYKSLVPLEALNRIYNFAPFGGTALNDGIGQAVRYLEAFERFDQLKTDDWGYLVVILTDGGENSSHIFSGEQIEKMITEKQKTGHWTFAFMVPKGHSRHVVNNYGALRENVTEWEQNRQAFEAVQHMNQIGTANYMSTRSAGGKALTTYFKTDLSSFDPKKSKLLDVTGSFKTYKVDKESDITTFYQYKTGKTYNPLEGKGYYQLTKKELIQPQKHMVVRNKDTKIIYGGDVREALGMGAAQNGVNMKVDPGNHSNYDIFIQSTSPNRKLVRGSEFLVVK